MRKHIKRAWLYALTALAASLRWAASKIEPSLENLEGFPDLYWRKYAEEAVKPFIEVLVKNKVQRKPEDERN